MHEMLRRLSHERTQVLGRHSLVQEFGAQCSAPRRIAHSTCYSCPATTDIAHIEQPHKENESWILAENLKVQPPLGPNELVHSNQYTRRYDEVADKVMWSQKAATTLEE